VSAERKTALLMESALREEEEALAASSGAKLEQELRSERDWQTGASEDHSRLTAELEVAYAQEAAATSVATQLRAELIEAEHRINELLNDRRSSKQHTREEDGFAMWEIENAELQRTVQSAVHAEMQEFAMVERLRADCDSLKSELNAQAALASASRALADDSQKVRSSSDRVVASPQAANREHELKSALAASEHQREIDRVKLESEKKLLEAKVELLRCELANQGSARSETGAARLMEENRRLQCQLLAEFATAASAAVEASAAASVAASSVQALQEQSRATRHPKSALLDVLYDELRERTPSPVGQLQCSTNTFHSSPPKKSDSPNERPRLSHAGDIAAGGSPQRRTVARSSCPTRDAALENELGSKERREESEDDEIYSPLSKPFLGGPLGLARALAMRSAPVCRSSGAIIDAMERRPR
jgi:hypothetical protein